MVSFRIIGGIKLQRGNLVIYDRSGKIWYQSGEAQGDVLPHTYPDGLPYLELEYGEMEGKRLVRIDLSSEMPKPVFEILLVHPTYEELQDMIEMMAGGII